MLRLSFRPLWNDGTEEQRGIAATYLKFQVRSRQLAANECFGIHPSAALLAVIDEGNSHGKIIKSR